MLPSVRYQTKSFPVWIESAEQSQQAFHFLGGVFWREKLCDGHHNFFESRILQGYKDGETCASHIVHVCKVLGVSLAPNTLQSREHCHNSQLMNEVTIMQSPATVECESRVQSVGPLEKSDDASCLRIQIHFPEPWSGSETGHCLHITENGI